MLFLHGSPHSNHAFLMEKVTPDGMEVKPYPHDVENFTPHAKYMVLSIEDNKIVHIERNEILYDWHPAA